MYLWKLKSAGQNNLRSKHTETHLVGNVVALKKINFSQDIVLDFGWWRSHSFGWWRSGERDGNRSIGKGEQVGQVDGLDTVTLCKHALVLISLHATYVQRLGRDPIRLSLHGFR
ncbi:hypothetical protein RchiOBHm_Chr1g0376441 [Rosa chinensis]|uniref:Uncharacterized protein n=1 Tax=Rosa chinensis TaxID=74649 RepID=A0A2P6SMU4_ROSCH|nr:hypothetical protein RchiOBHm_Chr1g0376441 [Rosa chinensis]